MRAIAVAAIVVWACSAAAGCGGSSGAGAVPSGGDAGGPCTVTAASAICHTQPVVTITNGSDARRVYWAGPAAAAPPGGRPAVILYQGTGFGPATSWDVSVGTTTAFGGYYQVALIASLIDAGFVVVQPEAQGGVAWDTNSGGNYDTSADGVFIPQLLAGVASGTFGPVDMTRLYATGISSGGYMTSRMAVSYAGKFRALAIESGSYATCLGPLCSVPTPLPSDHPPTLFLHGGADNIVPISTARTYYQDLLAQGIPTRFVEDASAGHQWLSTAPGEVTQWFEQH